MPTQFPVHYTVSVDSVAAHLFAVSLHIQHPDPKGQHLSLPAWIPGSYMIRNFARHIISMTASDADGKPVAITKTDKQTWQVAPSTSPLTIRYQVFAFDLSVRSAYLCDDYGFFNGTSMFLKVHGQDTQAHGVTLALPDDPAYQSWDIATSLPTVQCSGSGHHYACEHYAALIDHPVLMGSFDRHDFHVDGVDFGFVLAGGHQTDIQRICRDLEKVCRHHLAFFGQPSPVDNYLFMTLLTDNGYGGLEHTHSTVLMFNRSDLPAPHQSDAISADYQNFLALCSHELWHTWHVKRIRPQVLKDATLAEEAHTEQLWIYEGFTSYYDDLSLLRAGLVSTEQYLRVLGETLTRLERNPGQFRQSVAESSFDAWTRFYLQDASSVNHIVSYYTKGAVIALCLDLLLRKQGDASLDDIMQALWQQFGREDLGTQDDDVFNLVTQHCDTQTADTLRAWVYGRDALPVSDLLADVGVTFHRRPRSGAQDKGGKPASDTIRHAFGAQFKSMGTGVRITQVLEGTPAFDAGLQIGDQVIAVNQWQIDANSLHKQLDLLTTRDTARLTLLRDKHLREARLTVCEAPKDTVYLTVESPDAMQRWLPTKPQP